MLKFLISALLFVFSLSILGQSPEGIWQTIDDNEGDVRTEVELYLLDDGKLEARVHHLFREDAPETCPRCPGAKKDQPLIGLVFMWGLEYCDRRKKWLDGRILEPESGRDFKCYVEMIDENHIKVRGYVGIPAIGRTQHWYRKH